ncbi:MAG: ATP-dependent helicase [Candidatus Rehaiarchaeum fermentans]|nr:ATP-dependent helicase [Candidatus Rehaiarchaeum fermentans]MCW1302482.1 ATP-dependent helicase [Candidatus Rehaiarchaeum fermentans]
MIEEITKKWFFSKFKAFTPAQEKAIKEILENNNVLVTAPTGSGKTLAAFLGIISELFSLSKQKKLEKGVYCIYVSPLKALINDVTKNLISPLNEIKALAKKEGLDYDDVNVGIRSSDVKSGEKSKQLRNPPKILCTTPESLSIMLSSFKFRENLNKVRWVVVDEIHSLAESKRGAHLTLSLERLEQISPNFVRIGLSATVSPLEEVAKFLVGNRNCKIIDARFDKKITFSVYSPVKDLVYEKEEKIMKESYKLIVERIKKNRTTLIFTNTRSGAERVSSNLKKYFPNILNEDNLGVHHSSVSRDFRLDLENKLKEGKLKAVVSSTSLELGIDIGYIDEVIQLGSPKSVSRLLQRIGRSGHRLNEVSKGILICENVDDLIEDSVMCKKAQDQFIDPISIIKNPLDVLAQHIVGMSLEKRYNLKEAYDIIKRAYPFSSLSWGDYISVIKYLIGQYHSLEERNVYSKIALYDKNLNRIFNIENITEEEGSNYFFGRKGNARIIYFLNSGTIPDETKIKVYDDKKFVGTLEEDFVQRLLPNDKFVLAGKVYSFIKRKGSKVLVEEAKGQRPTVPSWFSEELPLNYELAKWVNYYRYKLLYSKNIDKLLQEFPLNSFAKNAIKLYIKYQRKFLDKTVGKLKENEFLVEDYEKDGKRNIIFHTLLGRKVNDTLARAYAYILSKEINSSVGIQVNDNGFLLAIEDLDYPLNKIVNLVNPENLQESVEKSIVNTELFKLKFRQVAARSFMILRNYKGYQIRVEKQQMNADKILKLALEIEDLPVLKETFREILNDYMDIVHAKEFIEGINSSKFSFKLCPRLSFASPFSFNIITLGSSDVVLLEDRRSLIQKLYNELIRGLSKWNS